MAVFQVKTHAKPAQPVAEFGELTLVEAKLQEIAEKAQGIIRDACLNLINSGGKRIRPLLTLTSGMCFGPINTEMIGGAVAAELIHMASLIHDDIIDNSAIRRGQATVNSQHGSKVAVLAGDYLFAEAFNILSSYRMLESMTYLVEAIKEMCQGEVNQAGELFQLTLTIENYFQRIAQKTGILLAACCKSGASAAGASSTQIETMGLYGLNLGYAYQIVDDILDLCGDESELGKPVGLDIRSGNITLPVIYLLQNPVYSEWTKELITSEEITHSTIGHLREVLVKSGCISQSYALAAQCIENAKKSLAEVPSSRFKMILLTLADRVLARHA